MATTKIRTLGARLYPKLGTNWHSMWKSADSLKPYLPAGYTTYDQLCSKAASEGISIVRIWWGAGDNYYVGGEPRPGEFNYGGEIITRNGNGDITSNLYAWNASVPATNNIKLLLDACHKYRIWAVVELEVASYLNPSEKWDYHAYKLNQLNANDNIVAVGAAGPDLTSDSDFWTDADAVAAFKVRVDAWLHNFGDHEAVYCLGLGNELTLQADTGAAERANFFSWVSEISTYIWSQYGSHKPFINVSTAKSSDADEFSTREINAAYGYIAGGARMIDWHNYSRQYTLQQIKDYFDEMRSTRDFYTPPSPDWSNEQHKWHLLVGENWGFGPGPDAVPDTEIDINIQGDPVTHTYAYQDPPNNTVTPYPHERMYAFLVMALDPTALYARWPGFLDGDGSAANYIRMMEITKVAKDFYDTAVFDPMHMVDQTGAVSSSGTLDFKTALLLPDVCLTFVLVGSGTQTINFDVTGTWKLVTYDWEGDGSDSWRRVEDETEVNAAAVSINFDASDYPDGFVPGYLIKDIAFRQPVRTTITTTVDVVHV